MRRKTKDMVTDAISIALFIAVAAFIFVPILWIISTSFMTRQDLASGEIVWIPMQPTLRSYVNVIYRDQFLRYFVNSTIVAVGVTLLSLAIAYPAAYAFSRYMHMKGMATLSTSVMALWAMPAVLLILPYFIIFQTVRLYDTHLGLIIAYVSLTLPISVWTLKGFFAGIPVDLEEAAMVDGCTRMGALVRIVFPTTLPGVASAALLAFSNAWQDLVLALALTSSEAVRTIPLGISMYFGYWGYYWPDVAAACVFSIMPILVLYYVLQRFFVRGLTMGAVKG